MLMLLNKSAPIITNKQQIANNLFLSKLFIFNVKRWHIQLERKEEVMNLIKYIVLYMFTTYKITFFKIYKPKNFFQNKTCYFCLLHSSPLANSIRILFVFDAP